jgi:hypothetical protein
MKLKVEELEENGYVLIDSFKHDESIAFLKSKSTESYSIFYYFYLGILLISFGVFSYTLVKNFIVGQLEIITTLVYLAYGLIICLVFIPFHEWLHALAYKLLGAKDISFFANYKNFNFATTAHLYVTNHKEFRFIATFPFVFVLILVITLFPFVNIHWSISLITFLMLHNLFCGGDFALLNFMENRRKARIVIYDDTQDKMTYFYKNENLKSSNIET